MMDSLSNTTNTCIENATSVGKSVSSSISSIEIEVAKLGVVAKLVSVLAALKAFIVSLPFMIQEILENLFSKSASQKSKTELPSDGVSGVKSSHVPAVAAWKTFYAPALQNINSHPAMLARIKDWIVPWLTGMDSVIQEVDNGKLFNWVPDKLSLLNLGISRVQDTVDMSLQNADWYNGALARAPRCFLEAFSEYKQNVDKDPLNKHIHEVNFLFNFYIAVMIDRKTKDPTSCISGVCRLFVSMCDVLSNKGIPIDRMHPKAAKWNAYLQLKELESRGIIKNGKVVLPTEVHDALSKYDSSLVKEYEDKPAFANQIYLANFDSKMPQLNDVLLQIYDKICPQLRNKTISESAAAIEIRNLVRKNGLEHVSMF